MQRVVFRALVCAALVAIGGPIAGQQGTRDGEWPNHGGDRGYARYSPLDQINKENVKQLRVAWRRPAVAPEFLAEHPTVKYGSRFRSTPIMVGGVLYGSNGVGLIEAIDPGTGKTIWVQELPEAGEAALSANPNKGVSHWRNGSEERLLSVRSQFLLATDPKTGKLIRSFGSNGRVDLRYHGDSPEPVDYRWNPPPLVVRDIAIVGAPGPGSYGQFGRDPQKTAANVRAYDVRTGKLRWTFHIIPRAGEFGTDSWLEESWNGIQAGDTNIWTMISADEELGLVYLPTSAPVSEHFGGHRPGNNLFSSSIVCVKADTGERVWHFQAVHHDVWDYDNPAPPVLADITVDGRPIKALVQVTKQAEVFVLDRVTGAPVWPIEERPVPKTTAPGEWTAPTQPFPTKPAPVDRQGITTDDLIDFTPELRAEAIEIAKRYVLGPVFTPPTLRGQGPNGTQGTLQMPGFYGGSQWGGAAFDPETKTLYVPSKTVGQAITLVPATAKQQDRYGFTRLYVAGPRGLPLTKPPYSRITAINMNTGDHVWMVPNGDGPRDHPAIKHLNLPPLGQLGHGMVLATRALLFASEGDEVPGTFIGSGGPPASSAEAAAPAGSAAAGATPAGSGASAVKGKFRAFDKTSGAVLWEAELPSGGPAITYMHNGKQYVVLPVGSRNQPAEWVALSLP